MPRTPQSKRDTMLIVGATASTASADAHGVEVDVRGPGAGNEARLRLGPEALDQVIATLLEQRDRMRRLQSLHGAAPATAVLTKPPQPLETYRLMLTADSTHALLQLTWPTGNEVLALSVEALATLHREAGKLLHAATQRPGAPN